MVKLLLLLAASQWYFGEAGQSNSNGQGTPALSTSNAGGGKRFDLSLYTLGSAPWPMSTLITEPTCTGSAAEQAICGAPTAESPWTAFDKALFSYVGRSGYNQFGSCAQGGIALASLPMGVCYAQLSRWGAGTPTAEQCILTMVHGEADDAAATVGATYAAGVVALQSTWQTQCRNTTSVGKAYRAPLVQMQMSSWTVNGGGHATPNPVVDAQRTVARDNANIYLAGPGYRLPFNGSSNVHYSNVGSRSVGWYMAQAVEQIIKNGSFRPLEPTAISRSNTTIIVTYRVPCSAMGTCANSLAPLALNTTEITSQTNSGFEYTGATITAVQVCAGPGLPVAGCTSTSQIAITINASAGGTLRYAWTGTSGNDPGPVTGARGNVCDVSNRTIPDDGFKLINCGVTFSEVVL